MVVPSGEHGRQLVNRSIDPVWEVNHVWLMLAFVVTWTASGLVALGDYCDANGESPGRWTGAGLA